MQRTLRNRHQDGRCPGAVNGGERGVTLLELLTVLVIISILTSLTLAGYYAWQRRTLREANFIEVELRLREARNFAIKGSVGSVAEIDPFLGEINTWSFRPVELLNFDTPSEAKPSGRVENQAGSGYIGACAFLDGGELKLPQTGHFIGRNGLAVRFHVKLAGAPDGSQDWVLFKGGDHLTVSVTANLALRIKLGKRAGHSRGMALVPGRWHAVTFKWITTGNTEVVDLLVDNMSLRIQGEGRAAKASSKDKSTEKDGKDEAAEKAAKKPAVDGSILFPQGLAFGPFRGLLDEAVVLSVVAGKPYSLSGEVFFAGKKQRIHFAPSGGLDRRYHDDPVAIPMAGQVEELKQEGRTFVAPVELERELIPVGPVSHIHVALSGRIRTVHPELPVGGSDPAEESPDGPETKSKQDNATPSKQDNGSAKP